MDLKSRILNFSDQFQVGINTVGNIRYSKPADKIFIAGIGGSIKAGEILETIMPGIGLNRDYDLPKNLDSDSLIICMSWSGNPPETTSAYEMARANDMEVVCITTGGRLAELATKNGTPLVLLPHDNYQPRFAIGFMTGALFAILGLADKLKLNLDPTSQEQSGKDLASKINNRIPLIYTTNNFKNIGIIWKALMNENCKIHAFTNSIPGLDHDEIAGFNQRDKERFFPIIIRDNQEDPRQTANINGLLAILDKLGYNYHIVNLSSSSDSLDTDIISLEKIFNSYVLALWTTYYLAQNLGVDPEDISIIEEFKALKK